jgi:uncharacterized protein
VIGPLKGGLLAGEVPKDGMEIWEKSLVRRTTAKWALIWVLNHLEVTSVLLGMGTLDEFKEKIVWLTKLHQIPFPKLS